MTAYLIRGRQALLPTGLVDADIRVEDGKIVDVLATDGRTPLDRAREIDARGLMIAPALVDIHGDAFERQVMPRPGVFFPMDVAVMDTDRQLAGCGVATAYHALTLSWEPGLRSVEFGEQFIEALGATTRRHSVDHRIQLRWETYAFEALPLIERTLAGGLETGRTPAVAFNDHTSMMIRAFDQPVTERAFEQSPDFHEAERDDPRLKDRVAGSAKRAGLSVDAYLERMFAVLGRRPAVDETIRRVADWASAARAPMLSHDDTQDETRRYYRDLGATIAEFPMAAAVARDTAERGHGVVLGAPNVLRGGSHIGSLSAADMIEDGLCNILASDYAYPAMLAAAGRLHDEKRADLGAVWATVSGNPARALGLDDRGEIVKGKRADLVAVEWPTGEAPAVRMTLSGGRIAFLGADLI